jgi:hypothetical protein
MLDHAHRITNIARVRPAIHLFSREFSDGMADVTEGRGWKIRKPRCSFQIFSIDRFRSRHNNTTSNSSDPLGSIATGMKADIDRRTTSSMGVCSQLFGAWPWAGQLPALSRGPTVTASAVGTGVGAGVGDAVR